METNATDVLEALQRITASARFERARRAAAFLHYVTTLAASGRSGEIKESVIALEVFERADYDPKTESLVRVEASKLRRLLDDYYREEGQHERLRISIPKGGYVPVIQYQESAAAPVTVPAAHPWRLWAASALACAVLLVVGLYWRQASAASHPKPLFLAVMPFADLSATPDPRFADGLMVELLSRLAGTDNIHVASRTAVSRFPPGKRELKELRGALGVDAVLDGSVRINGGDVRVTVQLVDAESGYPLWSDSLDYHNMAQLDVQRTMADAVAKSIRNDLATTCRALVGRRPASREAWHYYIRATSRLEDGEPAKAAEFFRAALAADSHYAPAWAGLSLALLRRLEWREARVADLLPEAVSAAGKALRLEPTLADAQCVAGLTRLYADRDWAGAEEMLRSSAQLDPTDREAQWQYARLLTARTRFREAASQYERALVLNPHSTPLLQGLAGLFIQTGREDRAGELLQESLALVPHAPAPFILYGHIALAHHNYAEALRRFDEAVAIRKSSWTLQHRGYGLAKRGQRAEALRVAGELEVMAKDTGSEYELAVVHAALGETERAFTELAHAVDSRQVAALWLNVDPLVAELRPDPRFSALLRRMHVN